MVVETRLPRERLEADLDRLAEVCNSGTKVVVIGHVNDVELYRALIRRGVSEYLVVGPGRRHALHPHRRRTLCRQLRPEPLGRSIAFVGGKGGVGSSTIAHNVAWAIARNLESDVVVADLDLAFGTAGLDFNQDPTQGIAEAVFSPDRIDNNFVDRLLSKCSENLEPAGGARDARPCL